MMLKLKFKIVTVYLNYKMDGGVFRRSTMMTTILFT